MQEKNKHLYFFIIIFIIFIEHISGQTSVGHIRGLKSFSDIIIEPSDTDPIFTTNLEESSYPSEISTNPITNNPTNPDSTHIDPTIKTSDKIQPNSNSQEIFTHKPIPESTEHTTLSSSDASHTEPTTTFNPKTTIPTSNPSTGIENSITKTTDNPFSTNPTEYTSIPSFETIPTLPSSKNTQDISSIPTIPSIPTTPSTQLNLNDSSYSPTILTTSINPTNNETIPTVPIIISDTEIKTLSTTTPIPQTNSFLVLSGFSHYNQYDSNISFYIYFSLIEGYINSNNLKFPVEITYNANLRFLQNNEANCNLNKIENQKITYLCKIQTENKNINNIKIFPEFDFISQTAGVTISPFSNEYINNLIIFKK